MIDYFFNLALILFFYMNIWFMISLIKKRNDIADIAWGLGFIFLTWVSFFLGQVKSERGILIGLLITIWGIRLAWHIYLRNYKKNEDYRYAQWRKQWKKWFYLRSYVQIYLLQGFLLYLIILPVFFLNKNTGDELKYLDFIGFMVWIVGFIFESVGDFQLSNFLKNPKNKGKIMQSGLWRYTRHPNYFGEVTMWWGIWLISLSSFFNFFSIVGPLTITFLILKVSGIPMLEKKYQGRVDFEEYKRKTSVFFPLPPKR